MPKTIEEIEAYKTKKRVGAYDPEEFKGSERWVQRGSTNNPWIEFARHWGQERGMTLGCAIRNRECRLEYNTKHKVKKSIKNVPPQLQAWVRHSKANARKDNLTTSCCFNNLANQESYHEGQIAVEPRKTPAKTLSVEELEEKLDRLIEEYRDVKSGRIAGNLKSIDANIIRTRILLDERENEYLKNPKGLSPEDEDEENEGRFNKLKTTKYDRTSVEVPILQKELDAMIEEYNTINMILKNDKKKNNKNPLKETTKHRLISHKSSLYPKIRRIQTILKSNNIEMGKDKKVKKPPRREGGSIGETARLGHPGTISESGLRNASQIPTPPRGYNDAFGSEIHSEPKRRGKLSGFGRISDRRVGNLFNIDASLIPM